MLVSGQKHSAMDVLEHLVRTGGEYLCTYIYTGGREGERDLFESHDSPTGKAPEGGGEGFRSCFIRWKKILYGK